MKRFVVKLLIFCLLPLPVLYVLQVIVDSGLKHSDYPVYSEWNDIYGGKVNADLVVTGSSRAVFQISPAVLDEKLKINTYNLGINAWTFPMQKKRFDVFLKHNKKPRYVVQSLDLQMFSRREDLFDYQQFLPYLDDPDIRAATKNYKGEFGAAQYYFPMFKYNGNLNVAAAGFLSYFNLVKYQRINTKGYLGQTLAWDNSFEAFKKKFPNGYTPPFDEKVAGEFKEYLEYCRQNDIKVILVFSPEYVELHPLIKNREETIKLFKDYAKQFDLTFFDYSNHPISSNKSYFYNSEHLNKQGAELFSEILARDLINSGVR